MCTVPAPCVGRRWRGVAASRCLDRWWNQYACSKPRPASQPCCFHGVSHEAFHLPTTSQAHKGFSYNLPSVQKQSLLKLVLPLTLMLVASLRGSSSSELLMWRERRKPQGFRSQGRFSGMFTGGLRAAVNLINFISNIVYSMVISQSGILLLLLFQRNMKF